MVPVQLQFKHEYIYSSGEPRVPAHTLCNIDVVYKSNAFQCLIGDTP